jgi:hypothetical protein|tara:strand:- start:130 stop:288 length:159 start_codon:yes stop_codon:yes gene_type:complete
MPKGYIGSAVKYARDEKEALKHFCGTKPDKDGIFRMKRGGIGKLKSITMDKE